MKGICVVHRNRRVHIQHSEKVRKDKINMPRKATVETESLWVPLAARCVCYACGVFLASNSAKNNCRLCFDVFCSKCFGARRLMPSHYGYTDPQPVCVSCELLLTNFVTFATQIHRRGAGVLLPPRQAVILSGCNLPFQQQTGGSTTSEADAAVSGSNEDGEGFFSKLLRRLRDEPSSSDNNTNVRKRATVVLDPTPEPTASFCNQSLGPLNQRGIKVKDAVAMFMVGWRPLNPSTAIVIGANNEVHLRLKEIVRVCLGATSSSTNAGSSGLENSYTGGASSSAFANNNRKSMTPSAAAAAKRQSMTSSAFQRQAEESGFNDGRITIELRGGYFCQLLVGTVQVESGPPSGPLSDDNLNRRNGTVADDADDNDEEDEEPRIVDFTSDPLAAKELVDRLNVLVRHCRTHFAFSDASMALHVDLCPS